MTTLLAAEEEVLLNRCQLPDGTFYNQRSAAHLHEFLRTFHAEQLNKIWALGSNLDTTPSEAVRDFPWLTVTYIRDSRPDQAELRSRGYNVLNINDACLLNDEADVLFIQGPFPTPSWLSQLLPALRRGGYLIQPSIGDEFINAGAGQLVHVGYITDDEWMALCERCPPEEFKPIFPEPRRILARTLLETWPSRPFPGL